MFDIGTDQFLSQHLTAILEFMYAGEVNVAQDQLPQFLKTAERLKVCKFIWLSKKL